MSFFFLNYLHHVALNIQVFQVRIRSREKVVMFDFEKHNR